MDTLNEFVKKLHGIREPSEQLKAAFYFVREIPYSTIDSHTVSNAIESNRANCHAKSQLLSHIFQLLGYETRIVIMQYRLRDYPAEVRAIPNQLDYHYVPEILLHNDWIRVDATYDPPLAFLGFIVNEWDGATSTVVAELSLMQKVEGQPDEPFDKAYAIFQTTLSENYINHSDEITTYQIKFNAWLSQARQL